VTGYVLSSQALCQRPTCENITAYHCRDLSKAKLLLACHITASTTFVGGHTAGSHALDPDGQTPMVRLYEKTTSLLYACKKPAVQVTASSHTTNNTVTHERDDKRTRQVSTELIKKKKADCLVIVAECVMCHV
jgi:hypothetical protein